MIIGVIIYAVGLVLFAGFFTFLAGMATWSSTKKVSSDAYAKALVFAFLWPLIPLMILSVAISNMGRKY